MLVMIEINLALNEVYIFFLILYAPKSISTDVEANSAA